MLRKIEFFGNRPRNSANDSALRASLRRERRLRGGDRKRYVRQRLRLAARTFSLTTRRAALSAPYLGSYGSRRISPAPQTPRTQPTGTRRVFELRAARATTSRSVPMTVQERKRQLTDLIAQASLILRKMETSPTEIDEPSPVTSTPLLHKGEPAKTWPQSMTDWPRLKAIASRGCRTSSTGRPSKASSGPARPDLFTARHALDCAESRRDSRADLQNRHLRRRRSTTGSGSCGSSLTPQRGTTPAATGSTTTLPSGSLRC